MRCNIGQLHAALPARPWQLIRVGNRVRAPTLFKAAFILQKARPSLDLLVQSGRLVPNSCRFNVTKVPYCAAKGVDQKDTGRYVPSFNVATEATVGIKMPGDIKLHVTVTCCFRWRDMYSNHQHRRLCLVAYSGYDAALLVSRRWRIMLQGHYLDRDLREDFADAVGSANTFRVPNVHL